MVYCGIPSRGCHSCRSRKTRCDQIPLPHGCTQCVTGNRICPGYRTPGELIFRDESATVVRKFKAREAKVRHTSKQYPMPPSNPREDDDLDFEQSLEIVKQQPPQQWHQQQPSLGLKLMPTIEERATGFFITNYVLSASGPTRGHLDYIASLDRVHEVDESLASSMMAVGLASYAHTARAPALMEYARRQYVRAVHLTNEALGSPKNAKKDSTLVSIMILGIFEVITGIELQSWTDHINGAAALVKLRGSKQLQSIAGRRMLAQIVSGLSPACLRRGVPVPEYVVNLMAEMRSLLSNPDPAFVVQEIMMEYTNLYARIRSGTCSDPQAIIDSALELDAVLLNTFANLPSGWEYTTMFTNATSDMVYDGQYHIYYDHWIAQSWNAMRILRILLHGRIREALLLGFSSKPPLFSQLEHTAQFQLSTDICFQLQADILASVPQHLGFVSNLDVSSANNISVVKARTMTDTPLVPKSCGYFFIWPLWFAGIMELATKSIRQYVIKSLKFIGVEMGLQQALVLSALLEPTVDSST